MCDRDICSSRYVVFVNFPLWQFAVNSHPCVSNRCNISFTVVATKNAVIRVAEEFRVADFNLHTNNVLGCFWNLYGPNSSTYEKIKNQHRHWIWLWQQWLCSQYSTFHKIHCNPVSWHRHDMQHVCHQSLRNVTGRLKSSLEWTVWILLHMWSVEEHVSRCWDDTQHIHLRSSWNITGRVAVHGSELFGFCYKCDGDEWVVS